MRHSITLLSLGLSISLGFLSLLAISPNDVYFSNTAVEAKEKKASPQLLEAGTKAPDFDLKATGGKQVSLESLKGNPFVLVFYPIDFTPGCTIQLCALRDSQHLFEERNTAIIASNPSGLKSHAAFAKVHNYDFPLLVDKDHEMGVAYGVNSGSGINKRTVYIVDGEGIIRFAKRGTPSIETLIEVLDKLNPQDPVIPL